MPSARAGACQPRSPWAADCGGARYVVNRSAPANISGLRRIERIAPARMRSRPRPRAAIRSSTPSPARMKENSPIWARLAEIVRAVATGWPKARARSGSGDRLADDDDRQHHQHGKGSLTSTIGSKSMPTDTKKSTAKASRNGSDLLGRPLAEFRLGQDHAGEEGAEREATRRRARRHRKRRRARSPAPPA